MKVLKNYWWLFLTLLIVTLIFIINYKGIIENLIWTDEPFEVLGQLAVKLVVIGALLDQLIAVFFPESSTDKMQRNESEIILNDSKRKQMFYRNESLRERLYSKEDIREELFKKNNEELRKTEDSIGAAEEVLKGLNSKRTGFVRVVAFAFSLILALAGITVLNDFIQIPSSNLDFNHKLINYLDIILTAALLSGGTSGIDQFFRIIRDSWKNNDVNP